MKNFIIGRRWLLVSMLMLCKLTIGYSQVLKELEGKDIIIPGKNPSILLYRYEALQKKSFKEKYRYEGSVVNKPIKVSRSFFIKRGRHSEASLVLLYVDGDSVVMRFPSYLKISGSKKDSVRAFLSQSNYSSGFSHYYTSDEYDIVHYTTIPHYRCENLKWIEDNMIGKYFYDKKEFGQAHSRISNDYNRLHFDQIIDTGNGLSLRITIEEGNNDNSIKVVPLDKFDGEGYGWQELSMKRLIHDFISEESLIAETKRKPLYNFYSSINERYKNKKVHINDISFRHSSKDVLRINNKEAFTGIKEGYYTYVGFGIFCNKQKGNYPQYDTYAIFHGNDSVQYAAPFSKEDFIKNVMLASDYDTMVEENRKQKEKVEKEQKTRDKAVKQAEWSRLVRKYGKTNAKRIYDGEIRLGFTKDMVIEAWGYPNDTTSITNALGSIECWIYGYSDYVYFKRGKVVQIIN